MSKVWFITGAARGMGVEFAKAGLAAGYRGVAKNERSADEGRRSDGDDLTAVALASASTKAIGMCEGCAQGAKMAFAVIDVVGVISTVSRKNNPALCAIGGRLMLDLTGESRQTSIDLFEWLRMSRLRRRAGNT